jgi:transposase
MQFHKEQIKKQVGVLTTQGLNTKQIAEKLNLSVNQVTHIKAYYFPKVMVSPQKRAWVTRKANDKAKQQAKQVEEVKPRLINLNGLEIEIHNSMVKRVIITDKDVIKII